ERIVELLQLLPRVFRIDPDDYAVRPHEVLNRRSLLQELRVGADVHSPGSMLRDLGADLRRRPDWYGALGDDDLLGPRIGHVLPDRPRDREHMLEIRGAV